MTKEEWLKGNNWFYHVTQHSNVESIIKDGLLKGNPMGICVIRSKHPLVVEYLIQSMLLTSDETKFAIIKIPPHKHKLLPNEITNDGVVEITNPLHNYILRKKLIIDSNDIIDTFDVIPNGIKDYEEFANRLISLKVITSLDQTK